LNMCSSRLSSRKFLITVIYTQLFIPQLPLQGYGLPKTVNCLSLAVKRSSWVAILIEDAIINMKNPDPLLGSGLMRVILEN
jgi:hypothetical protein